MAGFLHGFYRNRLAILGSVILAIITSMVIGAPMITSASPIELNVVHMLDAPDADHFFGTDSFGRDVFARALYGGRFTLAIGLAVMALAFVIGVSVGTVSGFVGGKTDLVVTQMIDAMLAFPSLVLAIALAAALGPSLTNAMLAVAITLMPQFARVARSQAIGISVKPYVEAAVCVGVPVRRMLLNYILRNGLAPLTIQASLSVGSAILQTASLGFLGFGAQPPLPEWGADIATNLEYVRGAPWVVLAPGSAIFLSVLSFNLIGDAVADWFNPRKRALR